MEAGISHIDWLGFIPFTIIMVSLFCIILASILIKPWKLKVTLIVIGSIFTLFVAFVLIFLAGGAFFSLFIP